MCKYELENLVKVFYEFFYILVEYVDVCDCFLIKFKGVMDLEEKWKLIGYEFIRVFEEELKCLGFFDYFV